MLSVSFSIMRLAKSIPDSLTGIFVKRVSSLQAVSKQDAARKRYSKRKRMAKKGSL
jgi:hypothetical protein